MKTENRQNVLIVEDDIMIADFLEEMLQDHGYNVCGIARSGEEAMALARIHHPALGVIDMRLANGEVGTQVAADLSALGKIGILYATGNSDQRRMDGAIGHGCITKPYTGDTMAAGLRIVTERMANASQLSAFPVGFRLLNA